MLWIYSSRLSTETARGAQRSNWQHPGKCVHGFLWRKNSTSGERRPGSRNLRGRLSQEKSKGKGEMTWVENSHASSWPHPHADPLLGCLPLLGPRLLGKPALRRKTAFWRNYYLSVLPLPSLPTAFPGGGPSSHHWTCSHCSLPITMHARSTAKILARFLPKKRPCPRCHRAYKHEPGVVPGLGELAGK